MRMTRTLQVNNRLIIMDGFSPLRYVDLATNEVVVYRPVKQMYFDGQFFYKKKRGKNGQA